MKLLAMILLAAGRLVLAGQDSEGAESLAPSAATPVTSLAPVVTISVDTAPTLEPVAVPSAEAAAPDSVRSAIDDSAPVSAPPAILPLAVVPAPASILAAPVVVDSAKAASRFRTIAIAMDTVGSSRDGRSTWAAVGLTLLLPGSGHRYLGHKTGAAIWMTADLLTWSTLAVAWQMGSLYLEDATEIANRHAGASLDADADPALLETIRDWRSRRPIQGRRDSYDEALLLQGLSPDSRFPEDAAHDWDWGSPEDPANNAHIASFETALRGYRTSRVVLTYAAGALLLSRAVAVADILRIRRGSASRAGVQAVVVPGPDGGRMLLAYSF